MAVDVDVQEKPVATGTTGVDAGADKGAAAPAADAGAGKPAAAKAGDAPAALADKPAGKAAAKAADKPAGKPAAGTADAVAKPDVKADTKPEVKSDPAKGFLDDDGDDVDDADADVSADASADKAPTDDKPSLPDQWRELFANGDDKALARLKRYTSPQNVVKALLAAEQKIRSGEYKKALDADATDEEKAEWRKENGIPEKPDDYKVADVDGYKWQDADKPVINTFLKELHGANASQAVIDKMLSTYAQITGAQKEAAADKDRNDDLAIRDHLRDEFGAEFRPMSKLMARALADPEIMPDGLGEILKNARSTDGTKLINTKSFANWLAQFSVENYGAGSMVTGDGEATLSSRETELASLMRSDIDKYQNGRNAKGQTFADELLEIRQKKANTGGRMRRA